MSSKKTRYGAERIVDTEFTTHHEETSVDFGGAGPVSYLVVGGCGKPGYRGVVRSVLIDVVAENFAAATTQPRVEVGVTGDTARYAVSEDLVGPTAGTSQFTFDVSVNAEIPAGSDFRVTHVPGTGTPTGISSCIVYVTWYKV